MAGNIRENREIRDNQKYLNHTHKVNNIGQNTVYK